jgi:hypothetical protein
MQFVPPDKLTTLCATVTGTMQPDLFDATPVPYQRTSHTSHKAAVALARKGRGPKMQRLLRAYVAAGARGLNDSEAHGVTNLLRSSLCSLRKALAEPGLIAKAGERMGAYGMQQTIWVATEAGRAAVDTWTTK